MDAGKSKRVRRDPATTKGLILDVTERLMVEEGYAAVSSRRVAQELGLNGATVHYYYPTTDDLFIALHQQMTQKQASEFEAILSTDNPLQALWDFQSGWAQSALGVEFLALSNHRKSIRDVLAHATNAGRDAQACSLDEALRKHLIDPNLIPSGALATIVVAIARTLANEERVGITSGHADVRTFISWAMNSLVKSDE